MKVSQTKRDISLSGAIKEALAFNDPRMSDRVFEQKLVKEIYQDDWAIRLGTRNPDYRTGLKKLIRRDVKEVIREVGRDNRNRIISQAYKGSSNSRPHPNFPKLKSDFLKGSAYERWALRQTEKHLQAARQKKGPSTGI